MNVTHHDLSWSPQGREKITLPFIPGVKTAYHTRKWDAAPEAERKPVIHEAKCEQNTVGDLLRQPGTWRDWDAADEDRLIELYYSNVSLSEIVQQFKPYRTYSAVAKRLSDVRKKRGLATRPWVGGKLKEALGKKPPRKPCAPVLPIIAAPKPVAPGAHLTLDDARQAVCHVLSVAHATLVSPYKEPRAVRARMLYYFIGHHICGQSSLKIGKACGGRDHSTVLHGLRKIVEHWQDNKPLLLRIVDVLGLPAGKIEEIECRFLSAPREAS